MKKSNLFDKAVQRSNMGNMRTNIETQSPKGTIILEGAEMDYATAPVIRKSLAAFAKNGIYGILWQMMHIGKRFAGGWRKYDNWKLIKRKFAPRMERFLGFQRQFGLLRN